MSSPNVPRAPPKAATTNQPQAAMEMSESQVNGVEAVPELMIMREIELVSDQTPRSSAQHTQCEHNTTRRLRGGGAAKVRLTVL